MRSLAYTHNSQYTYGYDKVYTGDWRFVPTGMTSSSVEVISGITNKYFTQFEEILTSTGQCYLNFIIPSNSPVILFSFSIDDDLGFDTGFTMSINSTNWVDGDWVDIPFTMQNVEYHVNTAQMLTFGTVDTDRYIKLLWTNSISGVMSINDIGIFKVDTNKPYRNDIWLALGASIQNSAINTTLSNEYARSEFGRDPLIINLAYPGRTISYLSSNVQMMLNNNPYAGYSFIHMGGNDVSNVRPWSGVTQSFIDDFTDDMRNVLMILDKNEVVNFNGRISFRNYSEYPIVDDGVYEENGSLPFNVNMMDDIIMKYNKRGYDFVNDVPLIDNYGNTYSNDDMLNVDGIHLTAEGKIKWREYNVKNVGEYIYNGVKAEPLVYYTWLEKCEIYVSIAEVSGLNVDITESQYYVTKLPTSSEKDAFQVRIDNIICVDCDRTNSYVTFGANTLINWNTISTRTPGAFLSPLVDDVGTDTSISIKTTSGFDAESAGYTTSGYQTGDDSGYFPDLALEQAWYARNTSRDVTLYNLDSGKTYSFELMASTTATGKRLTAYTIDGVTKTMESEGNYSEVVYFTDITPINNEIVINLLNGSVVDPVGETWGYGYINAMKVYWSNI